MTRLRSPLVAALTALTLAAGCARLPVATESASDGLSLPERRARLERIEQWDMRGRLAIDTGERAYQARFNWRQDRDRLRLTVRSALLGAGGFEVSGSAEMLTLRARGDTLVLEDPEADLSALYGWWLPVTSMNDWLMGLPDEAFPAETRVDREGRVTRLDQRLWNLEYSEYQLADGLVLPRRLHMSHGPLELDLRVDEWAPAAADSP